MVLLKFSVQFLEIAKSVGMSVNKCRGNVREGGKEGHVSWWKQEGNWEFDPSENDKRVEGR